MFDPLLGPAGTLAMQIVLFGPTSLPGSSKALADGTRDGVVRASAAAAAVVAAIMIFFGEGIKVLKLPFMDWRL